MSSSEPAMSDAIERAREYLASVAEEQSEPGNSRTLWADDAIECIEQLLSEADRLTAELAKCHKRIAIIEAESETRRLFLVRARDELAKLRDSARRRDSDNSKEAK